MDNHAHIYLINVITDSVIDHMKVYSLSYYRALPHPYIIQQYLSILQFSHCYAFYFNDIDHARKGQSNRSIRSIVRHIIIYKLWRKSMSIFK